MRILVAYGSSRGGTAGLAEMIGAALRTHHMEVEVRRAGAMLAVKDFDAVIVGGALYANRWHKNARRFVRRNAAALANVPVFFFSSGPLDDSASTTEIPPVAQVTKLMERVGALGHATFGGRLDPDVTGFIASKVAARSSGDFRDEQHVERWADSIATRLQREQTTAGS